MLSWLEDVDPRMAALTNLVTLVISVGTIVWGASSIDSSLNRLEEWRVEAQVRMDAMEQTQQDQRNDITHIEAVQGDLIDEVSRLRGESDGTDRGASNGYPITRWPRVVEAPPDREGEQEGRGSTEEPRSALPGDKRTRAQGR